MKIDTAEKLGDKGSYPLSNQLGEYKEPREKVDREAILTVAIKLAMKGGFNSLTRDAIALEAGVANGKINYVFKTMEQLKRAVMRAAVHRELKPIIAQGLAMGDSEAQKAPVWLKQESLATLIDEDL